MIITYRKVKTAFTLIELLVVIAVIGLIATLSVLALNNARVNARDSKRFSDIKQAQTALELFYNDAGRYPSAEEFNSGRLEYFTAGATSTYLAQVPSSPVQPDGDCSNLQNIYNYVPSTDGSTYTITFCVAKKNSDLPAGNLIAFPGGITYNGAGTNEPDGGGTCTPESDLGFCARLGKNCGALSGADNCGDARSVSDCGSCSNSQNCVNNTCVEFTCGADGVDYNGHTYSTVAIGTQCWLKENLKTHKFSNGADIPNITGSNRWDSMVGPVWASYYDVAANGDAYGETYSGYTAIDGRGICPIGWRVPSKTDFDNLIVAVGNSAPALKSCRTSGSPLGGTCNTTTAPYWSYASQYGNDSSGFSAVPGGQRYVNSWGYLNESLYLWTSTPSSVDYNYYFQLTYSSSLPSNTNASGLNYGRSIRCVKGENPLNKTLAIITTIAPTEITANTATAGGTITTDSGSTINSKGVIWSESNNNPTFRDGDIANKYMGNLSTSFSGQISGLWAGRTYYLRAYAINDAGIAYGNTVTFTALDPCAGANSIDYNGYNYPTVAIGTQCWLKENLKTHKFSNGIDIPNITGSNRWDSMVGPVWASYYDIAANGVAYGELYSGYTATDGRGICPVGWRVPSKTDFDDLAVAVGNSAATIKSCRMINSPIGGVCNTNVAPYWSYYSSYYGNDYYGFSAVPGGQRYVNSWGYLNEVLYLWTSTPSGIDYNYYSTIGYSSSGITNTNAGAINYGRSIRCVKGLNPLNKTLATITTVAPTGITANVATAGGTVISDNGSTISDKGVVWSEQPGPTTNNPNASLKYMGNMSTSFSGQFSGLWAGRTYYLRAYAINDAGIAYGNEVTFTTPDPCAGVTSVNYNNYNYPTVAIGLTCWFKENLRTHKFSDGSDIPNITGSWAALTGPAWASYADTASYGTAYGELYSGYTVTDARGVCPTGWHVPSKTEFDNLAIAANNSAAALKSCRTANSPLGGSCNTSTNPYWSSDSSRYGNDYYGFSALPAGERYPTSWSYINQSLFLWTSTASVSNNYYFQLSYATAAPSSGNALALNYGLSIRCAKD